MQTDEELINAFNTGNKQAFNLLMIKYQAKIVSLIFHKTKNKNVTKDLTQEVFIKVYKNLKNFQFKSSFYTYIYKIALNTINDYFKNTAQITMEYNDDIAVKHNQEDEHLFIEDQINKLSDKLKEVLILRDKHELSYVEIARKLSIPIGTVRSRIARARAHIIKQLKGNA